MEAPSLRILGFPVRLDPSFFVLAALMGMASGRGPLLLAVWVAVVLGSVLWHELGHAVAFRAYGCSPSIQLFAMGGLTTAAVPRDLAPRRHLVISLAGPAVGIAVGLAALAVEGSGASFLESHTARQAVSDLVFANLAWGGLNLLPILPLDGGAALSALLDGLTGGRGRKPALIVSVVTAVGAGLVALRFGQIFAAALAAFFCANNVTSLKQERETGQVVAGLRRAFDADPGERSGLALADALVRAGDLDGALELVLGQGEVVGADAAAVVGRALFGSGRYSDAAAVGEDACRRHPHRTLAYNVALARARGGEVESSLGWLSRAVDLGWCDVAAVDASPELAEVRASAGFAALRERMQPSRGADPAAPPPPGPRTGDA